MVRTYPYQISSIDNLKKIIRFVPQRNNYDLFLRRRFYAIIFQKLGTLPISKKGRVLRYSLVEVTIRQGQVESFVGDCIKDT